MIRPHTTTGGTSNTGEEQRGTGSTVPAHQGQPSTSHADVPQLERERRTRYRPTVGMFRRVQPRIQRSSDAATNRILSANVTDHAESALNDPTTGTAAEHVLPPPPRRSSNLDDGDEITPNNRAAERFIRPSTSFHRRLQFQPTRPRSRQSMPPNETARGEQGRRSEDDPSDGFDRSEQRFRELREELATANEKYNEKKAMLSNALKDNDKLEMNNHALITMYNRLEQERDELKLENQSLRSLNASVPHRKLSKKTFSADLPVMFHGIAGSISRKLLRWCDRETKEHDMMGDVLRRNWRRRSEQAIRGGITVSTETKLVPSSPLKLADRRQYFTPSFQNEKEMLIMMVDEEMESPTWASHFPTQMHKEECRRAICNNLQLKGQVKQTLSDRMSGRKRNARDKMFQLLGYFELLSRKSKTTNQHEDSERESQKREVHEKLVVKDHVVSDQYIYDFSVWRTEDVTKLACSTYTLHDGTEVISGDPLFKHNLSLHVLHEFRGYNVDNNPDLLSSIMILARLDSWIMTLAECITMEEGRGGQRQKVYNELFHRFLPMATKQLIEKIGYIVWKSNSEELSVRLSVDDRREDPFENENRTATRVMESRADECFYIAVRPEWFRENVTKYLGNVCDCYIGEGKRDGNLFHLHGMQMEEDTEYVPDTEEARQDFIEPGRNFARFRS